MSIFTSRVTKVLDVPNDAPNTITIRKLAPKALDAATKERQRQVIATFREMGGAKGLAELKGDAKPKGDDEKPDEPAKVDPMGPYDEVTLIIKGVTGWTSTESPFDGQVTTEQAEDLDEETRDWLANEILQLAKPSLYRTDDENEAAVIKG